MFLGLDIDKAGAKYALTSDGEISQQGIITLAKLHLLISQAEPKGLSLEYTGRMAEPWIEAAHRVGLPTYIMHSTERRAVTRIQRQRSKTDRKDARTLARCLYLWLDPQRRKTLLLPEDQFTEAASVQTAWTLRAMLASVDSLTRERTAAKQRAGAAARAGNEREEVFWLAASKTSAPEDALVGAVEYCKHHYAKEFTALLAVQGISDRIATCALATLMPIERFPNVNKAMTYCSLHMVRHNSAGKDIDKPYVGKAGHKQLKVMLYTSAMSQVRSNSEFTEFHDRLISRGKDGKVAVMAVACKMFRSIFAVLRRGESREQIEQQEARAAAAPPAGYIRQTEAGKILGLSRQRIGQMISEGKIETAEKDGRKYVKIGVEV